MNYRTLGSTGLQVSEIGFGAWAIGGTSEAAGTQWGWGQTPEADAILAIQRARELGVPLDTPAKLLSVHLILSTLRRSIHNKTSSANPGGAGRAWRRHPDKP